MTLTDDGTGQDILSSEKQDHILNKINEVWSIYTQTWTILATSNTNWPFKNILQSGPDGGPIVLAGIALGWPDTFATK